MPTLACDPILFHDFLPKAVGGGIHALDSNTVKAALVTVVPTMQDNTVLADLTQVSAGGGYSSGGVTCTVTAPTHVGGIYRLVVTSVPTWTGTGSGFNHRGLVFYNDTATNKNLIAAVFQSAAGQQTITNVGQSGTTATLTCNGHGFSNGDVVVIDRAPFPRLNGTFTVAGVTTNTFQITAPVSQTIASQAVTSGKVIRPEQVTTGAGATYTATPDSTNGVFAIAPRGVNL